MKFHLFKAFMTVCVCFIPSLSNAQLETIGPLTLLPGQTNAMVFTNALPPIPHYKELQFIGTVDVPAGAVADLFIEFDFLDMNGNTVVVPAPTSLFQAIGGAPTPVDTGILTLMFCPSIVSLHLTNQDPQGISMNVQGIFRHQCFPVPEPAGGVAFAGMCLAMLRRIRTISCG